MKQWFVIIALAGIVSGCGGNTESSNLEKPTPSAVQETNQNENSTITNESKTQDSNNEEAANNPEPSEEQLETPDAETAVTIRYQMNKVYSIVPKEESVQKNVVLLTFDDGPKDEQMLTKLLDTLDKHQAKAIFFVNGYRVAENPHLLKLIHDRKQIIGNHAWDHLNLKEMTETEAQKQIGDVQEKVKELTGEAPKFFRPPFGAGNEVVRNIVKEHGMLYMTWSNGSEDWVKKYQTPEAMADRVMEQLNPGSNILMHELPWTVDGMDALLTRIKQEGYGFVDPREIDLTQPSS